MKFSVVICTYNRRWTLARTLPTLLRQEFPPAEYEVIVVVDGSVDGSADMLRNLAPKCALKVLEQPNAGPALARNAAIAAASGEIVLVIDDDIICSPDLLARHLEAHEAAGAPAVVFGPVLVASESASTAATWWTEGYTDEYVARLGRDGQARWPRDMVMEANYSAPRHVLLTSGGYARYFRSREGAELGLRLHAQGLQFHFQREARVAQIYVKTPEDVVGDASDYGRSEVKFSRSYPEYRRHSMMARMSEGRWMPLARRAAVRWPRSAQWLLALPAFGFGAIGGIVPSRQSAVRLLNLRQGVEMLHGAAAETGSWAQLHGEFGRKLPIFLFHHVGPRDPTASPGLTLSAEKFAQTIAWLASHGYRGIAPSCWLRWLREGGSLPPKPVVLTFDDAYADLVEYAFPVLKRHGFSAGVYVVTDAVGGANSWDQGVNAWKCLDAVQIRDWSRQGIEFGAHTRTHADLTRLSPTCLEAEVAGSKQDLEEIVGAPVRTFAYPFGRLNEAVAACVARHYDLALGCDEGLNTLTTDPHRLRRTMVLPSDWNADLALRARIGSSPLHAVKAHLRVRSRLRAMRDALG